MKLSEIRPCDNCDGPIAPMFHILTVDVAMFNARATNGTLGLNQMFGGHALGLAEAMAPEAEGAVVLLSEEDPSTLRTVFICQNCYARPLDLAYIAEKVAASKESEVTKDS